MTKTERTGSQNPEILSDEDYCNAVNDLTDFYQPLGMSSNLTICNINSATLAAKILQMVYDGQLIPNPDNPPETGD